MAKPWYRDGLRFTCTQCGNCCTGAPGLIWTNDTEIRALATRLGLSEALFRKRYTRTVAGRGTTLIERADAERGHACVFWQAGQGCTVYEDRPKQCRTWPFWRPLIETQAGWEGAASGCPGMNAGERYTAAHIAAVAADDGLA
jgi:uncharacterized protein